MLGILLIELETESLVPKIYRDALCTSTRYQTVTRNNVIDDTYLASVALGTWTQVH